MKITYKNFFGQQEVLVKNERELRKVLKNLEIGEREGSIWDIRIF